MNSIREHYVNKGVTSYYQQEGKDYVNPQMDDLHKCLDSILNQCNPPMGTVLDLACGSGEVTSHIKADTIVGIDPYTQEAYFKRTGKKAIPYSFDNIIDGYLEGFYFDLIICSFAMHLLEISKLPNLCYALSRISNRMIILTPHKKPDIKWIWHLKSEVYINRVRGRYYEC